MHGEAVVTTQLNTILRDLLTAVNQTFLHSRMSNDWGFPVLGNYEYKRSIRLMKSADHVIERILFLEGLPNLQELGKLLIGENVAEVLHSEITLEMSCRSGLNKAIDCCEGAQDFVSRRLLESILNEAEAGIDWLEAQIHLYGELGEETYLQSLV
jgi:bacterioferritin